MMAAVEMAMEEMKVRRLRDGVCVCVPVCHIICSYIADAITFVM